jgi:hypothetical protein
MFAGHYAAGLALKRWFPSTPLWALLLGSQGADVLFMAFAATGIEGLTLREDQSGPLALGLHEMWWSHSLVSAVGMCAAAVSVGWALGRRADGLGVGLALASHWLLDVLVHTPDVPVGIGAGTPLLGTGLWNHPVAAFLFEVGCIVAAGAALVTSLPVGAFRRGVVALVAVMVAIQIPASFAPGAPVPLVVFCAVAEVSFFAWAFAGWWIERSGSTPSG